MKNLDHRPCPLCTSASTPYHQDCRRAYHQCGNCKLVFVGEEDWLSLDAERAEYDLHRNDPDDVGYRTFLSRLFLPLVELLPEGASGLDYGCGPGPALAHMFSERGHPVALYDPFYAPDAAALERTYDFVTATEVLEHMRRPARDLSRLWDCVKPGGYVGIMTKRVRDRDAFASWHYTHDQTHIIFFSTETFEWLGRQWQAGPQFIGADTVIFHKPLMDRARNRREGGPVTP